MAHLGQQIEVLIREVQSLRSEGQQLRSLVEDLVRGESRPVSSSVDIDLCLRADDPLEALRLRNQMLRREKRK